MSPPLCHLTSVGAIFSSTPAEFGVKAVVDRFSIIKPKVLFTIDKYRYARSEHDVTRRSRQVIEDMIKAGDLTSEVVVVGHLNRSRKPAPETLEGYPSQVHVQDWQSFMASGADAPSKIDFYRADFSHPIWIVFSSGTTGKPKSIYGPGGGIMLMRKLVEHVSYALCLADSRSTGTLTTATRTSNSRRWGG